MSPHLRSATLLLLLLLSWNEATCQIPTVSGTVIDQASGEPLPFVNVLVQETEMGGFSDANGQWTLPAPHDSVTCLFTYLGYAPVQRRLAAGDSLVQVILAEEDVQLDAVTILPEYSYDRYLFRKILAHKAANNPERHPVADHLSYTRTFVCLSNLDPNMVQKRRWKASREAFTQESDSSMRVPVFYSEEVASHAMGKDEMLRTHHNGVLQQLDQQVQSLLTQKLTTQLNFYDEQLVFLGRSFPGPLARGARLFYNIYVVDSSESAGQKQYKFDFYPKNERNVTFRGSFWVADGSFALTKVEATLPNSSNVNFVQDLAVAVQYTEAASGRWTPEHETVQMKVALTKKRNNKTPKSSYLVRKSLNYQPLPKEAAPLLTKMADWTDEEVFAQVRHAAPDSFETQAERGIEVLQQNPLIKTVDKLAAMSFTGYYNVGIIDLGPIYDVYRRNAIEGHRLTLTARTSKQFSKHFSVGGFLGYGTRNREFKYGGHLNVQLPTRNRTLLNLRYADDFYALSRNKYIEFVRENPFSQGDGNPISNFTSSLNPFMVRRQHASLSLQMQTQQDIGILIRPFYNRYHSTSQVRFSQDGTQSFDNRGLLLDARFSFHQPYDDIYFNRFYYGNGKPVIHLTAEVGQNQVQAKTRPYAHFQASIKNNFHLGPMSLRMLVDAGYIAGKVPFPLLHLPRGAQSLGLGRYNYSLLNHASFASDRYANAYLALNGGGILFNRIPGLNRLNIRESVSFKAFYGKLGRQHTDIFRLPKGIHPAPNQPYMEVGIGVANIFKFLRVEYVRRINNGTLMDQVSSKHGVRMRFQVSF